jgi:ATP:cob(I)alamin adenosyltransferase
MSIYTKRGDRGITDMAHTSNISKSDDRIRLLGTIDELNSHIDLVRSMLSQAEVISLLENIQNNLNLIAAGVSNPYDRNSRISEKETAFLETETDRMEALCAQPVPEKLTGKNRLAAEIEITRAVARRAERCLAQVSVKFGADNESKKFLNRLSDYLYILARYTENESGSVHAEQTGDRVQTLSAENTGSEAVSIAEQPDNTADAVQKAADINEAVIQEVLKRMGIQSRITLNTAKKLIEKLEQEALRRGQHAVIAVCNPEGNPVAVHVMDGAFIVSFDVAMKKAYTAVAVKMSTMELSKLAQPGETFYGVDKLDGGKIVIFGGGIPLKSGDTIIGGLGISGGTGKEDHSLAEYGQAVLNELM